MDDQDDFDLRVKNDFLSEAIEMLGWVEDQFLIFEQNPHDSKVVDEIFRMAHTVKGSAMTCGFTRLGEFAHVMETLLVKIREGRHVPDSETVDVLLRSNDTLRTYIKRLQSDFDAVLDTSLIVEELSYFIGDDLKPQGAAPAMAFGFFDDDEPAPASQAAAGFSIPPLAAESYEERPFDEASYLSLKAYLALSSDSSPEGVRNCLKILEQALVQLKLVRDSDL